MQTGAYNHFVFRRAFCIMNIVIFLGKDVHLFDVKLHVTYVKTSWYKRAPRYVVRVILTVNFEYLNLRGNVTVFIMLVWNP